MSWDTSVKKSNNNYTDIGNDISVIITSKSHIYIGSFDSKRVHLALRSGRTEHQKVQCCSQGAQQIGTYFSQSPYPLHDYRWK